MRWTWRGFFAAVLVGAVWVPYLGYLWQGGMPLIRDGRGMAAVGLVLGLAAWLIAGRSGGWLAATLGSLSLGCGVAALITRNDTALAVFVLSLAAAVAVACLVRDSTDTMGRV